MNVLNVQDIERELRKYAARACSSHVERWVMTVARNYILGKLPEKDVLSNFQEVCLCRFKSTLKLTPKHLNCALSRYQHRLLLHKPDKLPAWAVAAVERGENLMWFDSIQCSRREIWKVIEVIVLWFNNWKKDDPRLPRVDRISFPVATGSAALWYKDVSENFWSYVVDKPVLVKEYEHGFRWVKLVSTFQFEREGKLMNHCVGNGNYYSRYLGNGRTEYYSLRDRLNKPHATMEIHFSSHPVRQGLVQQCKGHGNLKPGREYQPYIRRFIADMGWTIVGDGSMID